MKTVSPPKSRRSSVAPPAPSAAADPALQDLLERSRPMLERRWLQCVSSALAAADDCVLFFCSSSGRERAHVVSVRGSDFASAWDAGAERLRGYWHGRSRPPRWLRVEVACSVRAVAWERIARQMAATKRNYWRLGIAFDAALETAFLAQECAGNALLYDGRLPVATPNDNNLRVYARRRYGREMRWPDRPEQPMWLFDTRAVFADADSVHEIEHEGRNRGYRKVDDWGADRVLETIRRGTAYLARQVRDDGRYEYGCFPCFDRPIPTYNTLRHASSTYALLEGWELTRDAAHQRAIDAALDCLRREMIHETVLPDGDRAAFLIDTGDEIKLGGNAVCLLAFAKHAELTGDRSHLPLMERLARGIVHMQDPGDGSFVHVLEHPGLELKQRHRIIYYDGEAAFGLMRLYGLTGDRRWLDAVEKAFGHFIEAEHWRAHDHWLGYCVNELTLHRPDPRYYRFGLDNVRDHLDFVLDRITTFPTLLELMMAANRMIERIGADPDNAGLLDGIDLDKFRRALHTRARYLLTGFFWPELAMFFRNPERVVDGFFIRHHGYRVRIDDVEHYLSGYVAYWKHLNASPEAAIAASGPAPVAAAQPVLPADLDGQANGKVARSLLGPVPGGTLHWRAAMAWNAMCAAAWQDGVLLEPRHVLDSYRSLALQERLFESRYSDQPQGTAEPVVHQGRRRWLKPGLAPAARPGTSMHGWGLAVDVDRVQQGARWTWLKANAHRFGWDWAYEDEPWHLCYGAGDSWPAPVQAHARQQQEAGTMTGGGWDADAVVAATQGTWLRPPQDRDWTASGLCFWSPSMRPGQMVVARFDDAPLGLNPVALARLRERPAAVIVDTDAADRIDAAIPVLRVRERKAAALAMGVHARSRMRGKLLGVTGSAGKTTTVAMLADVLEAYGATNRTRHNANLPPGIAWNLASMDWDAPYTVLEMAIGKMGESARMARPDVAVVTNVTAAHLKYHRNVDEVARRKARIFSGMRPGGLAVLNRDLPQWRIFALQAARYGLRTLHYGRHEQADVRLLDYDGGSGQVHAKVIDRELRYPIAAPGEHMAMNSLACLAAVAGMGLALEPALPMLARFRPLAGRGEVHELELDGKRLRVIDDAYNANPASMAAALGVVRDSAPPLASGRRVLILGDMRELEPQAEALHAALAPEVRATRPDLVLLCGDYMEHLRQALAGDGLALHGFADVEALRPQLPDLLRSGDLVLIKSSAGTRLSALVEMLLQRGIEVGADTGVPD